MSTMSWLVAPQIFARVVGKNSFELFEERHNRYRAFEEFADSFGVEEFCFGVFVNDVGFFDNAEFALSFGKRGFHVEIKLKTSKTNDVFCC